MACPDPFTALGTPRTQFNETWGSQCNWRNYLRSDVALIQGGSFLRENCVEESVNRTVFQCSLLDKYCSSSDSIFSSSPLLATCSTYSNVTLEISGAIINNPNENVVHSERTAALERIFRSSSIISTGLISYCSLVPGCSESALCSTASFYSMESHLSRQGVTDCWNHICSLYHATINPDFGGFGMILSYLTQLSIALVNLTLTAIYILVKQYRHLRRQPTITDDRKLGTSAPQSRSLDGVLLPDVSPHLRNIVRYLSAFHKLQCYYSITLQIASLIALYGPLSTTHSIRNPFDESFLLLLSINGILPIALMFYTLALYGRITPYHISLTCLSAVLASYTGITIVKLLLEPYDSAKRTRGSYIDWPSATGRLAPEAICGRKYQIQYPKKLRPEIIFLVGAALCDALIFVLIFRWLLAKYPNLEPFAHFPKWRNPLSSWQKSLRSKITHYMNSAGHFAAASIFLFCSAMEYFFFYQMLVPQYARIVNFRDWGFGQIVGIMVWAVVIVDLARHEIALLWRTRRGSGRLEARRPSV